MALKRVIKSSKYHIIYRKSFLCGAIKYYVNRFLKLKSIALNIKIENIEIMPDHVHLFVSIPVTMAISKVVNELKGYSSFETRKIMNLHNYKWF